MEFAKELTSRTIIVLAFYVWTMRGELPIGEFVKAKSNAGDLHMWWTDYAEIYVLLYDYFWSYICSPSCFGG